MDKQGKLGIIRLSIFYESACSQRRQRKGLIYESLKLQFNNDFDERPTRWNLKRMRSKRRTSLK